MSSYRVVTGLDGRREDAYEWQTVDMPKLRGKEPRQRIIVTPATTTHGFATAKVDPMNPRQAKRLAPDLKGKILPYAAGNAYDKPA